MKPYMLTRISQGFILLSALSLLSVSLMAFNNPQDVMDLVGVTLPNTDAYSSIRGVYGGVGITLTAFLFYWMLKDIRQGLLFLSVLWSGYAGSRIMTIAIEGTLGSFGTQWLIIESVLAMSTALLYVWNIVTLRKQSTR